MEDEIIECFEQSPSKVVISANRINECAADTENQVTYNIYFINSNLLL